MIIFIYGPDNYRSNEKLKEIVAGYKEKHKNSANFFSYEWTAETLTKIADIFGSPSIFSDKMLVVIKDACAKAKRDAANLIKLAEEKKLKTDKDTIVVFYEQETLVKNELSAWLQKNAQMSEEFEMIEGARINLWIRKEVVRGGGQISEQAAKKLSAFVGHDLWQMKMEVDKLLNFKAGKQIEEKDIDILVKSKMDSNIFATIDALASRNKFLAYKLLHEHLAQGENEIYILTMFIYQFRNLLEIKNLIDAGLPSTVLAKKTGLHPFVIKKSWSQLRNFSQDVLKKIYERLLSLDIAIKRGRLEPELALDLIVGEIAG